MIQDVHPYDGSGVRGNLVSALYNDRTELGYGDGVDDAAICP